MPFPRLDVPQFVLLTFDDSVTPYAADLYRPLSDVTDSRGCAAKTTWYVSVGSGPDSGVLSKCPLIRGLRRGLHEIASHTYNHVGDPSEAEILGAVDWLEGECGIPRAEIRGFRAPFLKFSQDTLDRLSDLGFLYDSSISDSGSGSDGGRESLWPYTLDHGVVQGCANTAGTCDPAATNPGLWEVPMWTLFSESGSPMQVMDWPGNAYENLSRNFAKKYQGGNRSPLGVYLHAAWLQTHGSELRSWMTDVLRDHDDVYFVTNAELIEYMRDPVSSSEYASRRECGGQTIGCLPPPISEGGCGHGTFDDDICACRCTPPFGGASCLAVGQPAHGPVPRPTAAPTRAPTTESPTTETLTTDVPSERPTRPLARAEPLPSPGPTAGGSTDGPAPAPTGPLSWMGNNPSSVRWTNRPTAAPSEEGDKDAEDDANVLVVDTDPPWTDKADQRDEGSDVGALSNEVEQRDEERADVDVGAPLNETIEERGRSKDEDDHDGVGVDVGVDAGVSGFGAKSATSTLPLSAAVSLSSLALRPTAAAIVSLLALLLLSIS